MRLGKLTHLTTHQLHASVFALTLIVPLAASAASAPETPPASQELPRLSLRGENSLYRDGDPPFERRWFLFAAIVNAYPKLEREELIKKYFNPAMRLIAPGFDDVRTVTDLRDDHLILPPHIGVGRTLSERWSVLFQAGYTAGKVRTKATDPSIFILPLHTDFEIRRSGLFWGFGVDYYPWKMPKLKKYKGIWPRLRATRPFLGTRLTWTRATFTARIKVGFPPLGNVLSLKLSDSWALPSINTDVGFDIPINRNSALSFNAGYNFFFDQREDFEGPAFTVSWKHYLD